MQQTSEEAGKSRDSVINKLAVLQEEHRNFIDQVTDKEKRVRELLKVRPNTSHVHNYHYNNKFFFMY